MARYTPVSVICTVYNHQPYVVAALRSVLNQTYPNIELIVIDNASTDGSVSAIEDLLNIYPSVKFIRNDTNKGLCVAFNQGLKLATGKYIVDFSADDLMLPNRIKRQVEAFEMLSYEYGVIFSNARYTDANDRLLHYHYQVDEEEKTEVPVPSGDVYKEILKKYFICTPTMMMRRSVLEELGGYDETLSYEDFDFWVRSSVKYKYFYQDEVLTLKRVVADSLSTYVYKKDSGILESTYAVCNKAYDLNRTQEEFDILARRIRTFIRKCFYAQEFELAMRYRKLLNYIEDPDLLTEAIVILCRLRLPVTGLYRLYLTYFQKSEFRSKQIVPSFVISET
ncbi:glycosyltransferase [Telluribacter sp.]|uniref:glycosyltransferase n=1 Tax=Telluribacter sp. TaxID=1978767 RepID=UPI002E100EB9|nr:glycosyltransferase [Telluribacter sp.]